MKPVFSTNLEIRWRDLDDFGHVNHADYFTYFEHARAIWWRSLGFDLKTEQGPVVVHAECSYLKPLFFPDKVAIQLSAGSPGRSSYVIHYELTSLSMENALVAKASTKIVWVDYQKMKSVALPAEMLAALPPRIEVET